MNRSKNIIRISILGVVTNLVLVTLKALVGFFSNSIAILLDAVNNLTDALASVITIIGTKLAGRRPDKKHPYGFGRIEDITSIIIAAIILVAGVTAFRGSLDKIINPEEAHYTIVSLVVIAIAVIVKFTFGRYVKRQGKKLNSESLVASGTDSTLDSAISASTLVAAIISMIWGVSIEGYLGIVISIVIFKAGIDILRNNVSSIIGVRIDSKLSRAVKERVESFEDVLGAYDLILNQYGPENTIGSVHIEVEDDMTAKQIHGLSRRIVVTVFEEFGIILTVGIYASNTKDPESALIKQTALELVQGRPEILQMHGFYVDEESKIATFDLIIDFGADAEKIRNGIVAELERRYPTYRFGVFLDGDYSD